MGIAPGNIIRAELIINATLRVVATVKERDGTPLELIEIEDIVDIIETGEIVELVEVRHR